LNDLYEPIYSTDAITPLAIIVKGEKILAAYWMASHILGKNQHPLLRYLTVVFIFT
jgi:hypothetical protein